MTKQFDDSNRGALFKNDRKTEPNHSDYNGSINVGGHDYWLNAWLKTSRDGKKFMSLSVKLKDGKPPAPTKSVKEEMDDEIPF